MKFKERNNLYECESIYVTVNQRADTCIERFHYNKMYYVHFKLPSF